MKYYSLVAPVLLLVLLVSGCGSPKEKSYIIEGKITNPSLEGRTVYMQDALTGTTHYDSTIVEHGTFRFTGKQDEPVVRELLIQENDSDMFPVTLPFVLENGKIEVDLGERVYVDNTPLNKEMMDVLMAIDQFTDRDFANKNRDDIRSDFSILLMEQIVKHSNSPVGKFRMRRIAQN
ncbi:MAG: DUF4369 domain-containing protein [Bacteroides sp.]|nr:DUF4369 domain-containing protein [Bacteroides sp.]